MRAVTVARTSPHTLRAAMLVLTAVGLLGSGGPADAQPVDFCTPRGDPGGGGSSRTAAACNTEIEISCQQADGLKVDCVLTQTTINRILDHPLRYRGKDVGIRRAQNFDMTVCEVDPLQPLKLCGQMRETTLQPIDNDERLEDFANVRPERSFQLVWMMEDGRRVVVSKKFLLKAKQKPR